MPTPPSDDTLELLRRLEDRLRNAEEESRVLGEQQRRLQALLDRFNESSVFREHRLELSFAKNEEELVLQREELGLVKADFTLQATEFGRQAADFTRQAAEFARQRAEFARQKAEFSRQAKELAECNRDLHNQVHQIVGLRRELAETSRRVEELLQSRIWRGLVWVGGLLLRFRGGAGVHEAATEKAGNAPVAISVAAAAPLTVDENEDHGEDHGTVNPAESGTSVPSPPETAAPVPPPSFAERASASRHTRDKMTPPQWEEVLGAIIESRPKPEPPRITIITPAWNSDLTCLAEAAISVLEQSCGAWEWCIVDDCSTETAAHQLFPVLETVKQIRVRKLGQKRGISGATNEGLRMASGEYVCFLDHDDVLAPSAVAECLELLDEGLDAVYTDSDKIDAAGVRSEPFYKPAWSPEYFRGVMYIGHLLCVRRDLALKLSGFDSRFDGVQDYEFMLRYSEATQRIGHIAKVLYHWRSMPGSVAASSDAKGDLDLLQRKAVQEHLTRVGLGGTPQKAPGPRLHRVQIAPDQLTREPRVSILIPTRDAPELLEKCLGSIFGKTTYRNFEVVCIDNETTDSRALRLMRTYPVKRVPYPGRFNYSRSNNIGAREASGEVFVLMNNDVEVISPNWIQDMLYYARQEDVGAAGALLLYPDNTVQHAGIVLGCHGTADHVSRFAPAASDGYGGTLVCAHEVSAVTAACLMVEKGKYERAGGFVEYYHTAYQDVDLGLQLRSLGLRNIFTPRARMIHLEARTRGTYYDLVDRNLLLDRWGEVIQATDPYYNPNLNLDACDFSVKS